MGLARRHQPNVASHMEQEVGHVGHRPTWQWGIVPHGAGSGSCKVASNTRGASHAHMCIRQLLTRIHNPSSANRPRETAAELPRRWRPLLW